MNGTAVPLVYVSAVQINCQVPYELAGQTSASVVVQYNSQSSAPANVPMAAASPGIVILDWNRMQAAVLNQNYSVNSVSNPAKLGETIMIFGTGCGPLDHSPATGAAAGAEYYNTIDKPVVTIGGQQVTAGFSGLSPGAVSLWQVNVAVPAGATPGDSVPLQILHQGVTSNSAVIAVAKP